MRVWKSAALAAAGLLALAGCGAKPTDSAAFEKQAKEDVRKFIPAFDTGDVETILAQYAPDAEVMAPGNPRAVGHDAIRALVERESAGMQAAGHGTGRRGSACQLKQGTVAPGATVPVRTSRARRATG